MTFSFQPRYEEWREAQLAHRRFDPQSRAARRLVPLMIFVVPPVTLITNVLIAYFHPPQPDPAVPPDGHSAVFATLITGVVLMVPWLLVMLLYWLLISRSNRPARTIAPRRSLARRLIAPAVLAGMLCLLVVAIVRHNPPGPPPTTAPAGSGNQPVLEYFLSLLPWLVAFVVVGAIIFPTFRTAYRRGWEGNPGHFRHQTAELTALNLSLIKKSFPKSLIRISVCT
jgi:hypothetical protein